MTIFAIVQDTNRSENPPYAVFGTMEYVTNTICDFMYNAYNMPTRIATLNDAANWFSGTVEEDDEKYDDTIAYNNIFWWDTENM